MMYGAELHGNDPTADPSAADTTAKRSFSATNAISCRSFGHVRGNVDKIILQTTHRTLGLIDRVTQSRIDVRFGPELDSIVKQIQMGMEVDTRGFIRANDSELPSMDAEELMIIREGHRPLVTAEDLEGTIGLDSTGGFGSVDFASALRDNDAGETLDGK
ncbi:hypothetical protein [Bifidobacterium biavatii]|nr:hypothetical protein [Bifidobacterium biavatii]